MTDTHAPDALAAQVRETQAAMAGAVKVKPLEWTRDLNNNHACHSETAIALGITYQVYGGGAWTKNGDHHYPATNERNIEAAKSAAQADFCAFVSPILQPDTDRDRATWEAGREAAIDAMKEWVRTTNGGDLDDEQAGWNWGLSAVLVVIRAIANPHEAPK